MNRRQLQTALTHATEAARVAGRLMRQNLHRAKIINEEHPHDIKLALDVQCQERIENRLRQRYPGFAVLGEEGVSGAPDAEARWVIDPIDGTVNFAHDVPHACTCIALQIRTTNSPARQAAYATVMGVIYDPFCEELWTAIRDQPARLNGRVIQVSRRAKLAGAMVTFGVSKSKTGLARSLPYLGWLCRHARKVRMMGSAGLGLAYVASGRFDAYVERSVRLWDFAAGALLVECAGGEFWNRPVPQEPEAFRLLASNGRLRPALTRSPLFRALMSPAK